MKDFYLITPEGDLCHADVTKLANGHELLRRVAKAEPVIYRNYPSAGYVFKASPGKITIGRKLEQIKLNTWFAPITLPTGESRITPVFYDNGMAVHQSLSFIPPDGNEFWFFMTFAMPDLQFDGAGPFLCWHRKGDNIYRPPLSNTFDDGRICMGRTWSADPHTGKPVTTQLEAAIEFFQEAGSNTDLRPGTPPIPLLLWEPNSMAFDARGWEAENIQNYARSLSGWVYDGFFQ